MWVAAPPTGVTGLGLGVVAPDGAGVVVETTSLGVAELATAAVDPDVSALPGELAAEVPTCDELEV